MLKQGSLTDAVAMLFVSWLVLTMAAWCVLFPMLGIPIGYTPGFLVGMSLGLAAIIAQAAAFGRRLNEAIIQHRLLKEIDSVESAVQNRS